LAFSYLGYFSGFAERLWVHVTRHGDTMAASGWPAMVIGGLFVFAGVGLAGVAIYIAAQAIWYERYLRKHQ
jgi:hypothetical protein